ncbi:MAG TPA: metallophosphoesterase [bacterium]|nr:metallophosphoesterase [bacterium]HOM26049.1 metallophosphoesterase [bacterium]
MKLLLLSDLHYKSDGISKIPERNVKFGIEFLKRIQKNLKEDIDVVIIAGDLLDDGENPDSEKEYLEIKKIIDNFNAKKVIIAPGNHDKKIEEFFEIFGDYKYFVYDNFLFYVFYDRYYEGEIAIRSQEEIENFKKIVRENPDKKIIAVQHNIIFPKIESDYPFNLLDCEKIHKLYKENNVFLSISGHYHRGLDILNNEGVYYFTLPAVCEEPFKYFLVEISSELKIEEKQLKNKITATDFHCHTEFGYCAEDVSMEKVIERCKLFGVEKVYFTEHAGQLYLQPEDYWNFKFFYNPDILKKQRDEKKDRIKDYVEKFKSLNSNMAGIGLEVEIDKNGKISLLEEDRKFFEILVGAVHYLPDEWCTSKSETEKKFLWSVEKLIENKIDILAHPFRFFYRKNLEKPEYLYRDVVKMLKEGKVKAEINYHHNNPEYRFFRMCMEENVKIVFGSDSHNLIEVGDFSKHIEFLEKIKL